MAMLTMPPSHPLGSQLDQVVTLGLRQEVVMHKGCTGSSQARRDDVTGWGGGAPLLLPSLSDERRSNTPRGFHAMVSILEHGGQTIRLEGGGKCEGGCHTVHGSSPLFALSPGLAGCALHGGQQVVVISSVWW